MNDIIPGATYRDTGLGKNFTCNGISESGAGGVNRVVIEYEHIDEPTRLPVKLFREDPSFELVERP